MAAPVPPTVSLDHGTLGQLAYHVRCSATLAAAGRGDEAAPHAILARALLDVLGGDALAQAVAALDLPDAATGSASAAAAAHRTRAIQLGVQLVAHFTSEGRHDLANLYQDATARV
jgi:hypothetical protein